MSFTEGKIKDSHLMVHNEFTESLHGKRVVSEARRRADILRGMQNAIEIKGDLEKIQLGGCSKCRARLENPHADYHLTAVIDDSKI